MNIEVWKSSANSNEVNHNAPSFIQFCFGLVTTNLFFSVLFTSTFCACRVCSCFCSCHSMPFVRLFSAFIHFRFFDKTRNALLFAIEWKRISEDMYRMHCVNYHIWTRILNELSPFLCFFVVVVFVPTPGLLFVAFCFLSFCAFRIWIRV